MISTKIFFDTLKDQGINFFCGVPDSLLKDLCAYISDNTNAQNHIVCANEGNAIALCAGHYLANSTPGLVYMQNSGLGNCINPLLSLVDEEVYKIPLLMLIGWRGEVGTKDEPQHIKQGKVSDKILKACQIDFSILPQDKDEAVKSLINACNYIKESSKPYALIIRKGTFEQYTLKNSKKTNYKITREFAISEVVNSISENAIIISTTGQISRELYEIMENANKPHNKDFLTVGSMGHASSIALGIALKDKEREVYCLDGDGSMIMHLGSLPVISKTQSKNFKHIVLNNEAHDSVGAQPTCADKINFVKLAKACGYKNVFCVKNENELKRILKSFHKSHGPSLLEIKVKCGARTNLGRPKETPCENKKSFMEFLNENTAFLNENSFKNLSKIIKKHQAKNILLFCTKNSFKRFEKLIKNELKNVKYNIYSDIEPNPKAQDVQKALEKEKSFDFIVAIGGGSVIDFAKLFRFCNDNKITPDNAISNSGKNKFTPLVAVPTTAGTGAEATKFSVIYVKGKKYSFENQNMLPDYAIIDGRFSKDSPRYIKACCAADALCQAIESYWSVNSTKESKYYAKIAMELCKSYLCSFVNSNNKHYAQKMAQAAFYSGRAINISKTTAAHALSYKITTDYNIAHGHAVSLSIKELMKTNEQAQQVIDLRGETYLKNTIREIKQILKIENTDDYFDNLFKNIGLEQNIAKLGIKDANEIAQSVNIQRLKNNPVELTKKQMAKFFTNTLEN